MADLKNRGLPHAAKGIQDKIDAAKRAQVAAENRVKAATDRSTEATKDQDLSVAITNVVPVSVSFRDIGKTQTKYNRYTTTVGT